MTSIGYQFNFTTSPPASQQVQIAMDLEGKDFHHPYSPYDTQLQFMKALYECIEEGKVGIFESPTGTLPLTSTAIKEQS